jgi:hypothetical protein
VNILAGSYSAANGITNESINSNSNRNMYDKHQRLKAVVAATAASAAVVSSAGVSDLHATKLIGNTNIDLDLMRSYGVSAAATTCINNEANDNISNNNNTSQSSRSNKKKPNQVNNLSDTLGKLKHNELI